MRTETHSMANQDRKTWIAIANVLSCYGVIVLHCNHIFWEHPTGSLWITANFIETFFYWPVPIFFMITGATLMNYRQRYTTSEFFVRRIKRTVIPFIIWSIIAFLYRNYFQGWEYGGIRNLVSNILNTQYIGVYWFFIPLFAVYMSMPLLSLVSENQYGYSAAAFTAFITFILVSILPTIFQLLGMQFNTSIQLPVAGGYILFVLLGYLIRDREFTSMQKIMIYCLGIIGWFIQYEGTTILSRNQSDISTLFKGYVNFPAVLQAVAVLIFIKSFSLKLAESSIIEKVFKKTARFTLGIYLMHFYYVEQIPVIFKIDTSNILWRLTGPAAIFTICLLICIIVSRIPIAKRIIGL